MSISAILLNAVQTIRDRLVARGYPVDEEFYFTAYPDVALSGMSASEHFKNFGWREARNPSPTFNTAFYVLEHMGATFGEDPLLHYLKHRAGGAARETSPASKKDWLKIQKDFVARFFDAQFYIENYGDDMSGQCALDHYFSIGWLKGFDPRDDFSTRGYLESNPHLQQSDLNPFFHHILTRGNVHLPTGIADGQSPTSGAPISGALSREALIQILAAHFDKEFYLENNHDVKKAGADPLLHYIDYGFKERRRPTEYFHTDYYISKYPDVIESGTEPFAHYILTGSKLGYKPNPIGTDKWPRPKAPAKEAWQDVRSASDPHGAEVVVMMPAYRGYDDTLAAIYSVLSNPQKSSYELLVVFDAGPEEELKGTLRELAEKKLFSYVENEVNLGFVGSVNRAIEIRPNKDVILLNSDTVVFGDWIDRLLSHARRHPRAATITPFSNNATICSYPLPNQNNNLALECSPKELDAYFSQCNEGLSAEVPTGVGFCFYMRRAAIDEIGTLDPEFGRGYGEENDFCMRAIKAGYTNLFAHDVFVFHTGQVSFGEFRATEFDSGQYVLSRKHPDFLRRVHSYIAADPSYGARVRADLFRLAKFLGSDTAVLVSNPATGGLETHIAHLAGRLQRSGMTVLIVYIGTERGEKFSFRILDENKDLYIPSAKSLTFIRDADSLALFLSWLKPKILHVHSLVTLRWEAINRLVAILAKHSAGYYVTLHDYDTICHRHHLVDLEGKYCSIYDIEKCRRCISLDRSVPDFVDPAERQSLFAKYLTRAKKVFVPSHDAKRRLLEFFPDVDFLVREHEEDLPVVERDARARPAKKRAPGDPLRLCAIGAIGAHKGSDLLYAMSLDAKTRSLPLRYYIVGYSAIPHEMREAGLVETGRYSTPEDCLAKLREIDPDFILIPSIWPETYCYTLSIALAWGTPVIAFDMGAQAERLRNTRRGILLDKELVSFPEKINDAILKTEAPVDNSPTSFKRYEPFVRTYYDDMPPQSHRNAPNTEG